MASVFISLVAGAGWQFFDDTGLPLNGGLLYTYAAGTTTPLATYTDHTGLIQNSNPIQLDTAGRPPAEVWLAPPSYYKFVIKDSNEVLIRTYDFIPSVPLPTYPLSIEDGGTGTSSFTSPDGNIFPLIFYNGTKLSADSTVADLGYNSATNTIYVNNLNVSGNGTVAGEMVFSSTGAIKLPVGTSSQEPLSPVAGMLRFNSTTGQFEGYNGSYWNPPGGIATGGGTDHIFVLNGQTVTTSYSIPSGMNAESVGPIAINSGISVTVPSGSRWVIL